MAALRGVVRACWQQDRIDSNRRDRLLSAIAPIRGSRPPTGRALTTGEIGRLYALATSKERAILALLLWAGLRRAEVQSARLEEPGRTCVSPVSPPLGGRLVDTSSPLPEGMEGMCLMVEGKGSKTRRVILQGQPVRDLAAQPGVLGMGQAAVYKACRRLARRTGVSFTPHDLRRTYASMSLDQGTDLSTVQQAMGHSDPRTTARYDRRGMEAQAKAAQGLARMADLCYNGDRGE